MSESQSGGELNLLIKRSGGKNFVLAVSFLLAGILSMALARSLHAAAGDLDLSFHGTGIVTQFFPGFTSSEAANAVAVQADSKIVVVGQADYNFAVARVNPNGMLDTSFGFGGKVTTDFGGSGGVANGVAIQTDGKIVVAGMMSTNGGFNNFAVVRYLTDGNLDITFGNQGVATFGFGVNSYRDYANAIAIQPDGKIVLAGVIYSSSADFCVVRLNTNGTLDTSFGNGGMVETDFPGGLYDEAYALTFQPDGKIIVVGQAADVGRDTLGVVRYTTNGVLDASFGTNGLMTVAYGYNSLLAQGVVIQPDGKIVVGGRDLHAAGGFVVTRLATNGLLDATFNGGIVIDRNLVGSAYNAAYGMVLQTNGQIVICGSSDPASNGTNDFILWRFNADGTDDKIERYSSTNLNLNEEAKAIALQPDGKIAVAGYSSLNGISSFAVFQVTTDLNYDPGFQPATNTSVAYVTNFPTRTIPAEARFVTVQADGKIIVGGHILLGYGSSSYWDVAVARYLSNGDLDTTFASGGLFSIEYNQKGASLNDGVVQPDGKILLIVGGFYSATDTNNDPYLLRLLPNGTLDAAFGNGGRATVNFGQPFVPNVSGFKTVTRVITQPDGKILAFGNVFNSFSGSGNIGYGISRFNSDGTLDTSFGSGGSVSYTGDAQVYEGAAIQSDGKIVTGSPTFAFRRFLTNGTPDTSFANQGVFSPTVGGNLGNMLLLSDGRILGVGNDSSSKFTQVVCLATNGTLDSSFGNGGIITNVFGTPLVNGNSAPHIVIAAATLEADGKILLCGGSVYLPSYYDYYIIARLLTNGSLDGTFGTNGLVTADFGGNTPVAIALQQDGRIVLAGVTYYNSWSVLRFLGSPMPPVITIPSNIIAEATSASGAIVSFTTSATNWSGAVATTNVPPSGSTFPIGLTTVTVTATDTNGSATNMFTVTVQDTTPPAITLLGRNPLTNNIHTRFTDPGATATDAVAGDLTGAIIVTGTVNKNFSRTYMLTYTVSDGHGNTAFTNRTVVIVTPPPALNIALTGLTTNFAASFGLASTVSIGPANLGYGPAQVLAADINGDGSVDLIIRSTTTNVLTVLTNNGSGGFVLATNINVINAVRSVAAADINGDGSVDLIYTAYYELKVLTNNGAGNFGSNASYFVTDQPNMLIAADVNSDGMPDLITANITGRNNNGSLIVATNDGNGSFIVHSTTQGTVAAGTAATVAMADVNGDGKPDLISDNIFGRLMVWTNNGSGGFSYEVQSGFGLGNYSVVAADVNNDGKVDLICANNMTNTLTVFTNDGTGIFGTNAIYTVGNNPGSVVAADVNNDGWVDLICANRNDNTLTILTNNRSGGFVLMATLNTGNLPDSVVAADVNGDGGMDLISANFNDNTLTIWTNTPAVVTNDIKHFVISWPLPSTGYVLQQNTNLATANWTTFSGMVSSNSTSMSATIMPATGNLFFRLSNP